MTEVDPGLLWVSPSACGPYGADDVWRATLSEQWKACLDAAERVSSRRSLTNVLFVTLNSAVLALVGVFWQHPPPARSTLYVIMILAATQLGCLVWWLLLRSYRAINEAKYAVILMLETRLPAAALTAEWAMLHGRYLRLGRLEQGLPLLYAFGYLLMAALMVAVSL